MTEDSTVCVWCGQAWAHLDEDGNVITWAVSMAAPRHEHETITGDT